jgi:hypothetical protein
VSALVVLVTRVDISLDGMRLLLELPLPTTEADEKCRDRISLSRMFPVEMKRRGIEMRMVLEGDCKTSRFDRPLIKAIARARRWSKQLLTRETPSIRAIARQEGLGFDKHKCYTWQLSRVVLILRIPKFRADRRQLLALQRSTMPVERERGGALLGAAPSGISAASHPESLPTNVGMRG